MSLYPPQAYPKALYPAPLYPPASEALETQLSGFSSATTLGAVSADHAAQLEGLARNAVLGAVSGEMEGTPIVVSVAAPPVAATLGTVMGRNAAEKVQLTCVVTTATLGAVEVDVAGLGWVSQPPEGGNWIEQPPEGGTWVEQ